MPLKISKTFEFVKCSGVGRPRPIRSANVVAYECNLAFSLDSEKVATFYITVLDPEGPLDSEKVAIFDSV